MKNMSLATSLGVFAAVTTTALMPMAAFASHQSQKNLGRNIGIGGAAVGAYGLLHHNTAATVLGIGGAIAGAKMYEDNRKAESRDKNHHARRHYYYRHGHRYYHTY
jgi:hypothetical protein